jgi:hypothetical protein
MRVVLEHVPADFIALETKTRLGVDGKPFAVVLESVQRLARHQ